MTRMSRVLLTTVVLAAASLPAAGAFAMPAIDTQPAVLAGDAAGHDVVQAYWHHGWGWHRPWGWHRHWHHW